MTILRLSIAVFLVQMGFQAYTASLPLALARAGVADAAIGLVMGAAAAVQIPAALVGGRLVDTFGAPRLFTAGGILYLLASGVLLLPGVDVDGSLVPFVFARMLQGAGIAMVLPSALSLVPRMVAAVRVAQGLSIVGAAQNLTLVLAPLISLAILDATSLDGVAVAVVCVVVVGILLGQRLPLRPSVPAPSTMAAASRRFGITFRREWTSPLLIIVTYVAHWGAVTAYLPIRAEEAGASIGLYFAADGIAIFLMRFPTGWLVDRVSSRNLHPDRGRDDLRGDRDAPAAAHDAAADRLGADRRGGRRHRDHADHRRALSPLERRRPRVGLLAVLGRPRGRHGPGQHRRRAGRRGAGVVGGAGDGHGADRGLDGAHDRGPVAGRAGTGRRRRRGAHQGSHAGTHTDTRNR